MVFDSRPAANAAGDSPVARQACKAGSQSNHDGAATLTAFFDEAVGRFADKVAVEFFGRTWSYGEIDALSDRLAAGLAAIGVRKGTRVGLCLPNSPYSVIGFFAVLKAGGIVVNFNPLYTSREIRDQIRDSGTEFMFTLDLEAVYKGLGPAVAETGLKRVIVCPMAEVLPPAKGLLFRLFKRTDLAHIPDDPQHVHFDALMRMASIVPVPEIETAPEDIAVLQYTGGTTGLPKGAMLSHRALVANARQLIAQSDTTGLLVEGGEVMVCVLPFFHVFAMTVCMLYAVEIGASMLLVPRFKRDELIALMERRKPTLFPAVPTIYGAINSVAETRKLHLESLKLCISGGAPLPLEVRADFEELTGCRLSEGYGLTECSPVVSVNPLDGAPGKNGSAGLPMPGTTLEIRDSENPSVLLPKGVKGELWVRGPQVMSGYWNRPEETANVLRDGALRTGDIGYLDEEGFLFLVDRLKDMIICSGYNVYPRMIEEALYEHDAVAEAIVIGIHDEYRGEAPKAYVSLREGATVTVEELHAFLKPRLSKIELPKEIEIRDSLPKTLIGKLSKKELIAEERRATHHAAAVAAVGEASHVDA
ncbi:long-chain-fatty-acid--CoA ligase [Martelella endophytica]|uniref:AMP-dependent synthetase n=1 Tax=Martelella endophytica TaxID=1486262 RepID=A0A0D5LWX9_MAREN|nr:long-chain fatty acid--CoA ligase [Martelella endophytica]AJY48322.1 AMP-dependent synthetase [Martelella endophytica]